MDELAYIEQVPYVLQLNLFSDEVDPPAEIAEAQKWNDQSIRINETI